MSNNFTTFDRERQPRAARLIAAAVERGRIGHGYLFYGPRGTGKRSAALELAQAVLCSSRADEVPEALGSASKAVDAVERCKKRLIEGNHPDGMWIDTRAPRLGIADARAWMEWLSRVPYEATRRILVVEDAERLTREAQNALLKLLEEPPPAAHIVLITARPLKLIPTVRSRLLPVPFRAPAPDARLRAELAALGLDEAWERAFGKAAGDVLQFFCDLPRAPGERLRRYEALLKSGDVPGIEAVLVFGLVFYRDVLAVALEGDGAPVVLETARGCLARRAADLGPTGAARALNRLSCALSAYLEAHSSAAVQAMVLTLEEEERVGRSHRRAF